jgi:hypothetical protein
LPKIASVRFGFGSVDRPPPTLVVTIRARILEIF